jgi:hypothetical protein
VTPAQALGRFSTIRTKADMYARDPAVYDRTQFTGGAPTCAPCSCVHALLHVYVLAARLERLCKWRRVDAMRPIIYGESHMAR